MRVRFAEDVLADPKSWRILDFIVDYFLEQRHVWDIEDPQIIKESPWIQTDLTGRAGQMNLDALQKCYTQAIYSSPQKMHSIAIQVALQSNSSENLTPDEAKRCLAAPAYVIVENVESDGAFLDTIIYAFKRQTLLNAQTEGWWKLESRGGAGEIPKCVEQIRAETIGPLRVLVLCDSDRLYWGHLKREIQAIETYCQENQVPYTILQKREIENYLPVNVLQQRKRQTVYRAFLSLTQEQKDFYDMKLGFKKERDHAIVPKEQQNLFAHVPQRILDDLCGGFGKEIGQFFKTKRQQITEEAIRQTCTSAPKEIDNLLDQIESLL